MKLARKASSLFRSSRRREIDDEQTGVYSLERVVLIQQGKENQAVTAPGKKLVGSGRADAIRRNNKHTRMAHTAIVIHEDGNLQPDEHRAGKTDSRCHVKGQLSNEHAAQPEDDTSEESDESEDEVDETVLEDMRKLEENFKGISQRYRLINRIGEGTFSTVYKAEQLELDSLEGTESNGPTGSSNRNADGPPSKKRKMIPSQELHRRKPQFVALKKIYVTSSPSRIANELELLYILRNSPYICPLLTAFRHNDQVVAVLPYFRHLDFRLYYRDFLVNDMRHYFESLLNALHSVHKAGILHRDIKPTNFLYDHARRQGVLVDFGLAEKQGTDWSPCLCLEEYQKRRSHYMNSFAFEVLSQQPNGHSNGYPKNDTRASKRANRAGTRGFRAPEVLLKCTAQTTKIDIWSTGVILLTLLARRFPFFNSADDVDAMIEMASIFGKRRMRAVAAMHGSMLETNIDTIGEKGFTFERIILWASCREGAEGPLRAGEAQAVALLEKLMELDPSERYSAKRALQDEFFTAPVEDEEEKAEREAQELAEEQGHT